MLGEHNMNKNEQMIREQAYGLCGPCGQAGLGRSDESLVRCKSRIRTLRRRRERETLPARMFPGDVKIRLVMNIKGKEGT